MGYTLSQSQVNDVVLCVHTKLVAMCRSASAATFRWMTHQGSSDHAPSTVCRRIGGFRDWPLLEDVDLAERLRRLSPPVVVSRPVLVSARRWDRLGLLRTFLLNQYILCAWKCGMPPDKLAEVYSLGK